jgi:hypothetical protein
MQTARLCGFLYFWEFQIPNSKFQISNFKFQISNFKFQIPDFRFQIYVSKGPLSIKGHFGHKSLKFEI